MKALKMKALKIGISVALLLTSATLQARQDVVHIIGDDGKWGVWGSWQYCPGNSFAIGYSMKVESHRGKKSRQDDTAVNGIKLYCSDSKKSSVTSSVGPWGNWREGKSCNGSFLKSAAMSFEPHEADIDDTATNSVRFKCSNGASIQASGSSPWGEWMPYRTCPDKVIQEKRYRTVISGIRTRIEPRLGKGDDTALNGVKYSCSIVK